jgi:uncharacterized membrane protein
MQEHRYGILDAVRGLTVLSMVLYHACWDLVYLEGHAWSWFHATGAYLWQQSICWTFILVAGFCFHLGKNQVRRGLKLLLLGTGITLVTLLLLPQDAIIFGILFFLGAATLLNRMLLPLWGRVPVQLGLAGSGLLFVLLRNVNRGCLGFEGWHWLPLPAAWYKGGLAGAFLGFQGADFHSADYFSLLPWFCLYLAGYFAGLLWEQRPAGQVLTGTGTGAQSLWIWRGCKFLGRHALGAYILHQPLLLALLWLMGS